MRLGIASRLAACIDDPRAPGRVVHGLDEIIRFRILMIAAGYEDGNDADRLRRDPMFKLAMARLPEAGDLCSQATISRAENLPGPRALLRMGLAIVEHYCSSFCSVPNRIVLDIDDTFDAVHGAQQLCLFNAHHDEYGYQPIVVFDGDGRMVAAVLRPACRPKGTQIVKWLRRLIDVIRSHWPRTAIMLRGDSHYCTPEVLRFCRARDLRYIFGVATTSTLRKHVIALEASTTARAEQTPGEKVRRFKEFNDGAASWDCVERIIARVEAGPLGVDTRFIVTNLKAGSPRTVYQDIYCARGQRQSDAPVPAYRRLLAHVEFSLPDATSFTLARHPVRYLAPAPDQTRRPHRDIEEISSSASATINAGSGHPQLRSGQTAQVAGLSSGAVARPVTISANSSAETSPSPPKPAQIGRRSITPPRRREKRPPFFRRPTARISSVRHAAITARHPHFREVLETTWPSEPQKAAYIRPDDRSRTESSAHPPSAHVDRRAAYSPEARDSRCLDCAPSEFHTTP